MEQLSNGFTLSLSPGAFPLSTDSILLADFVRLPKNAAVLDLGSGCGTLGLLLCAREEGCRVTGIELDPQAHAMALENSRRNGLASRLGSICADLREIQPLLPPGSFSCCLSNPPILPADSKAAPFPRPGMRNSAHCPSFLPQQPGPCASEATFFWFTVRSGWRSSLRREPRQGWKPSGCVWSAIGREEASVWC